MSERALFCTLCGTALLTTAFAATTRGQTIYRFCCNEHMDQFEKDCPRPEEPPPAKLETHIVRLAATVTLPARPVSIPFKRTTRGIFVEAVSADDAFEIVEVALQKLVSAHVAPGRPCVAKECDQTAFHLGFCQEHYRKLRDAP